jgi:hypothetical protein
MAFWIPIVPIDGDCIPVVLPVVPEPLIPEPMAGRSDDPVVPVPIPLEPLPDCCASARGAATKTTAKADVMVLLSLLSMGSSPLQDKLPLSPGLDTPAAPPYARPAVCIVPFRDPAVERAILMPCARARCQDIGRV